MDDIQIVELYFARNENAISETQQKYGKYCHYIAYHILQDNSDAEECVNDTYLQAWNVIPPVKPCKLAPFLGKITRNLSLNRRAEKSAQKRGRGQCALALDELAECIPDADTDGTAMTDEIVLRDAVNRFLRTLPENAMIVFLQRYWYFADIREIADYRNMSENAVKVLLFRVRKKFKQFLEKEGIVL